MKKKSYSRIFTDVLPKRIRGAVESTASSQTSLIFLQLLLVWLVSLLVILSVSGYVIYDQYQQVSRVHIQERERLAYWEQVIKERPNYPAAYYQAALSSVRLRDPIKALGYLKTALVIDPNFTQAEVFAKEIQGNE